MQLPKQKTEAALLLFTKRLCKQLNIGCFKINSPAHRGVPDLLIVDRVLTYFIELKSPAKTGRLSALQKLTIQELTGYGGLVFIVDDFEFLECLVLALHAHCLNTLIKSGQ